MDWSKSKTTQYYGYFIDPVTWRETEVFQITGGKISRQEGGLRDSANIDCVNYPEGREDYIRIYMDVEQNGASEHIPIFTGLTSSPSRTFNGIYEKVTLQCYSVLKAAADILLDRGFYVAKNTNGGKVIADLLSVCPAPVEIEGETPSLSNTIIAEGSETRLTMTNKVLDAINWRMLIKGDGTITIAPKPTEPIAMFDALENDAIEPTIKIDFDWYSVPNVFRATQNNLSAIARDENVNSPYSIENRGREVWAEETNCKLNNGESIGEYAIRRLQELQEVARKANYTRRYFDNVYVGDIVRLHYPKQKLDGLYKVVSQNINIGGGSETEEDVEAYER